MFFLEINGLGALIVAILFVMVGVPIILSLIGWWFYSKDKKKTAKILFIIAGVYLIISLGICGSLYIT